MTLRASLRLAKRAGLWAGDIEAVLPVRFSPQYKPKHRFLSQEELFLVLPHLWLDHAARTAFIVASSACLGETDKAKREDVGKNSVFIRGTKRQTRQRQVPVVTDWQKTLLQYTLRYAQGEENFLFLPTQNYQQYLKQAAKKSRIEDFCPNDLRRTCAVWLRAEGAPSDLVAPILGHTDHKMVERVYGRLTTETLADRLRTSMGIASDDDCNKYVTRGSIKNAENERIEWQEELPSPRFQKRSDYRKLRNQREKQIMRGREKSARGES